MESTSGRRSKKRSGNRPVAAPPPAVPATVPIWAEVPFLLALGMAPWLPRQSQVVAFLDAIPALEVACLVWLSFALRTVGPGEPLRLPRAGWLVAAFPIFAAVTLITSANRGATLLYTLLYASYAAALWLAADITSRGGVLRLLGAILGGALVAGALGLQEYLVHYKQGDPSWRVMVNLGNPNFFAGYVAPALLLALVLPFHRPEQFKAGTWNAVLGLLAASLAGALMATGSRGALQFALPAGLVVFLVVAGVRGMLRDRAALIALGVMALLSIGVMGALSRPISLRAKAVTELVEPLPAELCPKSSTMAADESSQFRILTWKGTAAMGKARPLLGWGAGSFETAYPPHQQAGYTRHAHESYLQLFAEDGVPGVLLWIALLLAGIWCAWRAPRGPEGFWSAGVLAALVANAVHSVFDSILFVPVVALLIWTLLGMALRTSEAPVRIAAPAWRWATAALAGVFLLFTGLHLIGRGLLETAQSEIDPRHAAEAVDTLKTAEALLPWDLQVAIAQERAYSYEGIAHLENAIQAAQRVINLAPERPPSYYSLGKLREAAQQKPLAMLTYQQGLKHAPNEVELLNALAEVQEQLGYRKESVETYRKIVALEQSPVQTVHALGAERNYRFARGRIALAAAAEAAGDKEEAFQQRKGAACFLAERRGFEDADPTTYISLGDWEDNTERELRTQEQGLWRRIAQDYETKAENHLADLSRQQAAAVEKSLDRLEQIIRDRHQALQ